MTRACFGFWIAALAAQVSRGMAAASQPKLRVPTGFVIEKVASAPLMALPMFVVLHDLGRFLFLSVAQNHGRLQILLSAVAVTVGAHR